MQRRRFLLLASLLPGLGRVSPAWGAASFDEGIEYRRVPTPLDPAAEGRAEVLELFWYGCPHCYQLEPALDAWRTRHPDVAFDRLPAVLGERWAIHARAYYSAEALGVLGRIHGPLFDALHRDRRRLDDEAALVAFFAEQGIDATQAREAFASFSVDAQLRRAVAITRQVGVDGVPALLVNGRFLTSPTLTGSRERTLEVLDFLVSHPEIA